MAEAVAAEAAENANGEGAAGEGGEALENKENAGAEGGADGGAGKGGGKDNLSLIEGGGGDGEAQHPATWPETWREEMAKALTGKDSGDDFDKELKRLGRFKSPDNVFKSFREMERKMQSGDLKANNPFPADGTDDEKTAWRKENGIPETAEGYESHLEGIVIGEQDKPIVAEYLKNAHERNESPESVRASLDWYYQTQERLAAEQAERDAEFRSEAVEQLRADMGNDYRPNMQDLKNWLAGGPEGLADNLFGARLADGTLLGDNPQVLSFLVSQMREINPLSTVVPGAGADAMKTVEDRITEIKGILGSDPQRYKRENLDKELLKLVEARDKHKNREN